MFVDPTYAAIILAAAVLADLMLGEPRSSLHPVVWIGTLISSLARRAPGNGARRQMLWGTAIAVAVPTLAAALTWLVLHGVGTPQWVTIIVSVFLLKSAFAIRALGLAASRVERSLVAGNLDAAREGLSSLCSRDAEHLSEEDVVGATVESVAENTCDSFIAPVFYYCLLGVPGAVAFRALNTLDSMLGYHGRYEYLGKASARLDDLDNLIPARLTAALFLITGTMFGADTGNGWRMWRRDGSQTESPNAGQTMATMAGLLNVRLTKSDCYSLGDSTTALRPVHISDAWRIALAGMLTFTVLLIGAHLAF